MKKIEALLITLFFICFPHQSFAKSEAKNHITNIDVKNQNNKTEIKFESSKLPEYRMFTMDNPPRLVIDFKNGSLSANKSKFANSKIFKSVRTGINPQGQFRLVLDLNDKIKIDKSSITNPNKKNKNYYLSVNISYQNSATNASTKKISKLVDKKTGTVKYVIRNPSSPKPIIIIDAGHGGKDPGTIGKYIRSKEKYITLSYAKELKRQLDRTKKFRVVLTRSSDYFIPLRERVEISRKLKADLFISLHADSSPDRSTTGLSIYTLSDKSSDKQAELLAQKENKSDIIGGADFSETSSDILKTLINMSQRSTMNESARFAEITIKSLKERNVHILEKTHRFAGFRVLTAPDVPSVLIELGYLSNKYEEKTLNNPSHKKAVAEALVKGIDRYLSSVK